MFLKVLSLSMLSFNDSMQKKMLARQGGGGAKGVQMCLLMMTTRTLMRWIKWYDMGTYSINSTSLL